MTISHNGDVTATDCHIEKSLTVAPLVGQQTKTLTSCHDQEEGSAHNKNMHEIWWAKKAMHDISSMVEGTGGFKLIIALDSQK